MTCNNCARKVAELVQKFPGVHSVSVSIEARRASVRWKDEADQDVAQLVGAVSAAGYPARVIDPDEVGGNRSARNWHLNLWIGGAVTALLMLGEWVFHFGMTGWFAWTSFALAGVVQVYCGTEFYRGAWRQLKVGSSNMDTLVALGSTTAFGYSTWALFQGTGQHLYFMEAGAIITLISIGHWIEARVSSRASDALKSLMRLAPNLARRLQTDSPALTNSDKFGVRDLLNFRPTAGVQTTEVEVPVESLEVGDLVVLRPGDRVPVDGVVSEGAATVDEAMLTGESLPVEKSKDAKVFAGTTNLNGRLLVRVTETGNATALANIIAAVQRAQSSRANIQRLGDKVSNVFVPVVVSIAILVGCAWAFFPGAMTQIFTALTPYLWPANPPVGMEASFIIAAAVLIVACPCAMGLATPAAIMASANTAARRGLLIRDGVALEKAGQITAIIFDKTGTLTKGQPEVTAIWERPGGNGQAKEMAAALARNSTHPLSQALARISQDEFAISDWAEVRGSGVAGVIAPKAQPGFDAKLGSLRWLKESGVNASVDGSGAFFEEHSKQGATVVGLSLDRDLVGLFAVKDSLKAGAAAVVSRLQTGGLKTYLLTGDSQLTAKGIAGQVGIAAENIFAEVRPEQKAELVKKLQAQGDQVAFVGDGINDAPALEQADLGIAVSRASDVAREAADIILLKSEIEAVPEALGLAKATLRTIRQNLFWAFFYNAAAIPLAALGFMSPVLCAAAMGFSDLVVIGNALRLRSWRQ